MEVDLGNFVSEETFLSSRDTILGKFKGCKCKSDCHERPCVTTFPNVEKRVENTMHSGVFFDNFKLFEKVAKHCLE